MWKSIEPNVNRFCYWIYTYFFTYVSHAVSFVDGLGGFSEANFAGLFHLSGLPRQKCLNVQHRIPACLVLKLQFSHVLEWCDELFYLYVSLCSCPCSQIYIRVRNLGVAEIFTLQRVLLTAIVKRSFSVVFVDDDFTIQSNVDVASEFE